MTTPNTIADIVEGYTDILSPETAKKVAGRIRGIAVDSGYRNAILEEAAKVADVRAVAADALAKTCVANGLRPSDDLPFRSRAVASQCRAVATAIRVLKQEGVSPQPGAVTGGGGWSAGEREDVHEVLFGHRGPNEKGGFCANLGPYVQDVVNQLNEANDLLGMMPSDLVDHHRDLIEQVADWEALPRASSARASSSASPPTIREELEDELKVWARVLPHPQSGNSDLRYLHVLAIQRLLSLTKEGER